MGCIKGEHDTSFCGTRGKRERERQGKGDVPGVVVMKRPDGGNKTTITVRPSTPDSSTVQGRQPSPDGKTWPGQPGQSTQPSTPDSSIVLRRQTPTPTTTVVQTRQPVPTMDSFPGLNMMPRTPGSTEPRPAPTVITMRPNGNTSNGKPTVTVKRPADLTALANIPAGPAQVVRPDVSNISPLDLPVQASPIKRPLSEVIATPAVVSPNAPVGVASVPQLASVSSADQMAQAMNKADTANAPTTLSQGETLAMTPPVKPAGWAMGYGGESRPTSPAGAASLPGKVVFLFLNMTPCAQGRVLDAMPEGSKAAMLTDRVKAGIPGADAQAATMAKDAGELPMLASAVAKVADKSNTHPAGWAMMERGYGWTSPAGAPMGDGGKSVGYSAPQHGVVPVPPPIAATPQYGYEYGYGVTVPVSPHARYTLRGAIPYSPEDAARDAQRMHDALTHAPSQFKHAGAPMGDGGISCATAFRSLPREAQLRIMLGPSTFASETVPRALAVRLNQTGDAAHANAFVAWLRTRYAPDSAALAVVCGLIDAEARRAGLVASPAGDAMAQMSRAGYTSSPAFAAAGMAAMDAIDRDVANAARRAAADEQGRMAHDSSAARFGYRGAYGAQYLPAGGPVPPALAARQVTQAMWDAAGNTPGGQVLLMARINAGLPLLGGAPAPATPAATTTTARPKAAAPAAGNGIIPAEIAARGVTQDQWNAMPTTQAAAAREEIAAGNASAAQQRTLTAIGSALSTAATQARELINSLNQQALANRTLDNQEANAQRQQELALYSAETDRQLRTLSAQQAQASGSGDSSTAAMIAGLMSELQASRSAAANPPPASTGVPTWALVGGGAVLLGGLGFVGYKAMKR